MEEHQKAIEDFYFNYKERLEKLIQIFFADRI